MLVARDLEVTLPGAREPAVRGLTLAVGPGEWLALTGENGGGKTTLLLALSGLSPISGGTLTLDEIPFGPRSRADAAGRVAVVLQDPSTQLLQPTVEAEIAFGARNLGLPEAQVAEGVRRWVAALGLTPDMERDPATLSAGRQQIVLLAAALVSGPRLLLADEPTAHLDAAMRSRVREIVAAEIARGLAVVWATQHPDEVAAATRVVALGAVARGGDLRRSAAPAPAGPVAMRLRVAPDPGGEGPRVRVDRPLEIAVASRGVTALLGPNGSGKSILLRAAAGLSPAEQVRVMWEARPKEAPIVALQFPELQIFEEQVADELVYAAVARGIARPAALDAASRSLARLGFEPRELLARGTWTLSAGEKRLVEVVGALIAPAGLVLLDEPTAGLDDGRRAALGDLVRERAEAVPALVASQDHEWVESLGARAYSVGC